MTAAEAHAAAATEGLALLRAENSTGFRGVYHNGNGSKPFKPPGRKRPAASGAGPSAPPSKRGKQPADDDEEAYVVKAEAVSDDDDGPTPPAPAPPVLCYCERPAALLDGRWVCAQLVEGDFCILGREDE